MAPSSLVLAGVSVRQHSRARRLRLRLDPASGQPVLTAPKRVSRREIESFLDSSQGWITRQQEKLGQAVPFAPGILLPLFGDDIELVHVSQQRGAPVLRAGQLLVGGQTDFFARRVRDFVKLEASRRFQVMASDLMQALGVKDRAIKLRDTRSRWGSCSASGEIHLSWRLAFAPPDVTRYVIAHEVAHLMELNHSPRFWKLVNQLVGASSSQRTWLKTQGAGLFRIGVSSQRHGEEFQIDSAVPTRSAL